MCWTYLQRKIQLFCPCIFSLWVLLQVWRASGNPPSCNTDACGKVQGVSAGCGPGAGGAQVEHRFCGFESHLDSRVRSKIACSYPAMESGARSSPYHNSVLKERKITSTEEKISFPLGWKGNSFPCHCPVHPGMD